LTPIEALARLIGPSGRIVVLDCETTGLYSTDRVVEIALVTVASNGEVVDRWESLVNPLRDVGPTAIHGISGADVADAPEFADIAGAIALRIEGAVLAAHNLPFDLRMIGAEFARAGVSFDAGQGVDTLRIAPGKLGDVCRRHGIVLGSAHRALDDALATAELLLRVAVPATELVAPARFATIPPVFNRTVVRDAVRGSVVVATERVPAVLRAALRVPLPPEENPAALGYLDLLDRVLADLRIDADEAAELESIARGAGLGDEARRRLHERYLERLVDEVVADSHISVDEYGELVRVAAALGLDQNVVHRRTRSGRSTATDMTLVAGMRLCITGDVEASSKEDLSNALRRAGFDVEDAVTKRTDLLIAADPSSQSGKAEKARRYGIPIVPTRAMTAAAIGDTVEVIVLGIERLAAKVCERCGATWATPARTSRRTEFCDDCRGPSEIPQSSATAAPSPVEVGANSSPTSMEILVCLSCGRDWHRSVVRGRKPKTCPDCRG
jgi:DNA polymerase III subunit epsilon